MHRGDPGDARGSSQNNLLAEFLGDYNYAAATNTYGIAVWNDVRQAADCPAIDEARQEFVEAVQAGREQPEDEEVAEIRGRNEQEPNQGEEEAAPAPNIDCPQTPDLAFGNSDIWGGQFAPLP